MVNNLGFMITSIFLVIAIACIMVHFKKNQKNKVQDASNPQRKIIQLDEYRKKRKSKVAVKVESESAMRNEMTSSMGTEKVRK